MVNYTQQCGKNANWVWKALERYGPLPKVKLLKNTRLDESSLFAATRWLARENKIYKKDLRYGLGETNLVEIIDSNAGKVWTMLQIHQELDVSSLVKLTGLCNFFYIFGRSWRWGFHQKYFHIRKTLIPWYISWGT